MDEIGWYSISDFLRRPFPKKGPGPCKIKILPKISKNSQM